MIALLESIQSWLINKATFNLQKAKVIYTSAFNISDYVIRSYQNCNQFLIISRHQSRRKIRHLRKLWP